MNFANRLKFLRQKNNMTQEELAKKTGVALKTISRYENGDTYPRKKSFYFTLCDVLNCTYEELVSPEENFIIHAKEDYGSVGKKDAEELVNGVIGLMAGGKLQDEDKKIILDAITEAYYLAKKENKKYARKK